MQNRNLGFECMVLELFSWLNDYGYCECEKRSTIVVYSGSLGYVNVYHGRSSYEVGVEIGPPDDMGTFSYSMSELIRLNDKIQATNYRNPIATSSETLKNSLTLQSQRLKMYGKRIFTGDVEVWQELKIQKQQWSEEYAAEVLLSQVRPKAERSFREHDYKRVVELLSAVETRLTPTEHKKLEYARKKLIS